MQQDLANVPKQHIVWQVDGNIYGRQPAAAAYRQELENILLNKLDPTKYKFQRGRIDACVYHCKISGVILIHHIDDFDVCGLTKVTQAKVKGTNSNGARHGKHKRHQHGNNDMQAAKATKANKKARLMKMELAKVKRTKATKAKVKETTPMRASSATFAKNMVT